MILECQVCSAIVEANKIDEYWDGNPSEEPTNHYIFLRCPKCYEPFLVHEDNYQGETKVLYPQTLKISKSLPLPIQKAFTEAQSCFRSKAYTASAIMCRKTIEGICAVHNTNSRNLMTALKKLKEMGIIEQRLHEWADQLRIAGNEAAHDVDINVSLEDARDVLEFTNALLEYVFTFRERFDSFKKRRTQREST